MVISDEWSSYKEDNVDNAKLVKENLLSDNWWMKVDYILAFTFIAPIYDVLKKIQIWLLFSLSICVPTKNELGECKSVRTACSSGNELSVGL